MNRHLSFVAAVALLLNAGLATAQDADPAPPSASDAAQARRDADEARREAAQARREADQARREAQQQADQARRDAQRQAQEQARAQAEEARARAQAQAQQARAQADEARARAQAQAQQARDAQARARGLAAGSGEPRVYAPGAFDSLVIDGAGQVRLVQSDRDEVVVSGGPGAQDGVEVSLDGKLMHIEIPGGWKFWRDGRDAQVEVHVRHLNRLTLAGANDVIAPGPISGDQLTVSMAGSGVARFDQLAVGVMNVDISGAGEGRLSGKVDQLRLSVSGKGKVGAEQLRAGQADVSISGVGNAALWAVKNLRVQISGAGHVEYWGTPEVSKSISGFGSVDPRGAKE